MSGDRQDDIAAATAYLRSNGTRLPSLETRGHMIDKWRCEMREIDAIVSGLAFEKPLYDSMPLVPPPADTDEERSNGFVRLSEVVEVEVEWYWTGRIPRAGVVCLAGDGGIGK